MTIEELKIRLVSSIISLLEDFKFLVYLINIVDFKYYHRDLNINN